MHCKDIAWQIERQTARIFKKYLMTNLYRNSGYDIAADL